MLLSSSAAKYFLEKDYSSARAIYKRLSNEIGEKSYGLMVELCDRRLGQLTNRSYNNKETRKDQPKIELNQRTAAVFTNLGLGTVDGSTVFIANITKLYSQIFSKVVLISTTELCDNLKERIITSGGNIILKLASQGNIKNEIHTLNHEYNFEFIFIRSWGDHDTWYDPRYSHKVIYYWPLHFKPTSELKKVYDSIDSVAFQTRYSKHEAFTHFGEKSNILIPPLINLQSATSKSRPETSVNLCYTGTLRPECYSLELLETISELMGNHESIEFTLAIGKIFYKELQERERINRIIRELESKGAKIEYQSSQKRCEEILRGSHISFSLWVPTQENINQVSTKFLESYSAGCRTICFKTPLYQELLGENYPYFINSISDLKDAINKATHHALNNVDFEADRYLLSHFSESSHITRIKESRNAYITDDHYKSIFNNAFDRIYGLYIDEEELINLKSLSNSEGINIHYFKGIDARNLLTKNYEEYKKRPLQGDWELQSKKKRLTIGAYGHLSSFISILKNAKKEGFRKILILEADALIHKEAFSKFSKFRPINFKVLYLGAGKWNKNVTYSKDNNLYYPHQTTGTFAIALDHSVFDECIAEWEKFYEPTDIALWQITEKYKQSCYVMNPNLIIADVSRSKTTGQRSQFELSNRFGWDLANYKIKRTYAVGKYVNTLDFVINYAAEDCEMVITTKNGPLVLKQGDFKSISINDFVVDVNVFGLLVSELIFSDN